MRVYNDTERGQIVYANAVGNNTATITIAADPDEFWNIECLAWSVDKKPSNCVITIKDTTANAIIYRAELKANDTFNDTITFGPRGLQCELNSAIEITFTGTKMRKDLTVQYS